MKEKIISVLFVGILFSFFLLGMFMKDRDTSSYERRKLMNYNQLKKDFIGNLDDYLTDQFPFRDSFISMNSTLERYILKNEDSNDVYIKAGFVIDKNYPLDENSVTGFANKINYIKKNYLQNSNVFYTVIPDKGYFLDDSGYLKLDYTTLFRKLVDEMDISYIDIVNLLELDDYYKTDIHIKQNCYFKVIKEWAKYLGFQYQDLNYKENAYDSFYGASYSKVPSFIKPDKLVYLSNSMIENANVWHLEYENKGVYDIEELGSVDSYNVFLSGPSALIQIENKNQNLDKELIVFRDSFGSSFAPLLIPYYKKITLIDLRYIDMSLVSNYVDFENKDVLFAYSTLIVNKSHILKVKMS